MDEKNLTTDEKLARALRGEKMHAAAYLIETTPAMEPARRESFLRTGHNARTGAATAIGEELHARLDRLRSGYRSAGHLLRGLQAAMKGWEGAVAGLQVDVNYEAAVDMLVAPSELCCGDCAAAIVKGGAAAKCSDCAEEIAQCIAAKEERAAGGEP